MSLFLRDSLYFKRPTHLTPYCRLIYTIKDVQHSKNPRKAACPPPPENTLKGSDSFQKYHSISPLNLLPPATYNHVLSLPRAFGLPNWDFSKCSHQITCHFQCSTTHHLIQMLYLRPHLCVQQRDDNETAILFSHVTFCCILWES